MPFEEAVEQAVNYCIRNGILADFLSKNRAEAMAVCIYEYNEELHLKNVRDEGIEIGRQLEREESEKKLAEKDKQLENSLQNLIRQSQARGDDRTQTSQVLQDVFSITPQEAEEKIEKYW